MYAQTATQHPPINMTDMSQTLRKDLNESAKKLKRLKTKMVLKTTLTTVVLIGGVTTSILFPNPISAAIAIGCATLLSGSEGLKHTIQRIKAVKLCKKETSSNEKEEDRQQLVNEILSSVQNVGGGTGNPSAPPSLYPNLSNRGV